MADGSSGGKRYVEKWRLPPPLEVDVDGIDGDQNSRVGADVGLSGEKGGEKAEDEMDELEFLNLHLSRASAEKTP